jgi:DNA-binding response OmpR family regulator
VCLALARAVIQTTEISPERVLLVAHEPRLRESIRAHLTLDRYRCEAVEDGQAAIQQARETPFDLIVVDLAAPNVAGSQISRALRHQPMNRRAPIVIIASRNAEHAALNELEDGADDFLVKPFGPGELAARARAAIRRSRAARARAAVATELSFQPPPITYGDVHVDPSKRHVQVSDRPVKLTEQEFRLLYLLITNPGIVFSREVLLTEVWGTNRFVTVRSVDTLVSRLRRRLEPADRVLSRYLRTVRGVGYKLVEQSGGQA